MNFIEKLQEETNCSHKTFVIAEIGVNFNGDLALAKDTIRAAASSGASAVKFQTFKAEEFVADRNLTYTYSLSDGSSITETQYDMFKRLELPDKWHLELMEFSKSLGLIFFSSVADRRAVDLLESIDAPCFKLASEDLINIALVDYVASKQRPTIISIGMADEYEIDNAIEIFRKYKHDQVCIMQCVSSYPAPLESCNMRKLITLSKKYQLPVGFSDHTMGIEAAKIAVALGACAIEKHFTLDRKLPGPDHSMSSDPFEFKLLVDGVKQTEAILGKPELSYSEQELKGRDEFRRSIVAKEQILSGTKITIEMLAYKRPGKGLKPYQYKEVIGKIALRDINADQNILLEDLESGELG